MTRPPIPNRPPVPGAAPAPSTQKKKTFSVETGPSKAGKRIMIVSDGGMGKTTLASLIPSVTGKRNLFIDVEGSTRSFDEGVERIPKEAIDGFGDLRQVLQDDDLLSDFGSITVDTLSYANHVMVPPYAFETIKTEKGQRAARVEDYGWGKGFVHYDSLMALLMTDLDRVASRGIDVILNCHAVAARGLNSETEEYIFWESDLQGDVSKGKTDTRKRFQTWCDYVFFIAPDIAVDGGRAIGGDSRTIYTSRTSTIYAKHRGEMPGTVPFSSKHDGTLWHYVFGVPL